MVERMDGMPEGVIGLRAAGKLTRDDYREVLEPGLQEAVDSGAARVVFVIDDFEGLEAGAAARGPEDRAAGRASRPEGVEAACRGLEARLDRKGDAPVRVGDAGRARRSSDSISWRKPRAWAAG